MNFTRRDVESLLQQKDDRLTTDFCRNETDRPGRVTDLSAGADTGGGDDYHRISRQMMVPRYGGHHRTLCKFYAE
jgi:hypothetical protein